MNPPDAGGFAPVGIHHLDTPGSSAIPTQWTDLYLYPTVRSHVRSNGGDLVAAGVSPSTCRC